MKTHYDLLVLGGGKGGKSLAIDMAKRGAAVAMIEEKMIGGTCINVGCIPTKTLVQSAKVLYHCQHANAYGLDVTVNAINFKTIKARKDAVVKGMREANLKQFLDSGMNFIMGRGKFIGPKKVEVFFHEPLYGQESVILTADTVVINTGAKPFIPPIEGLNEIAYLTNETLLDIDEVPKHLLIIGGGYIGLEFAQMFHRFGAKVSVIEAGPNFAGREDRDVANELLTLMTADGIDIHFDCQVIKAQKTADGVTLTLSSLGVKKDMSGSHVLVSVGRIPQTSGLGLELTHVATDGRGYIDVTNTLETTCPGIYALGDVKGGAQFTHLSWDDYRILMHNLLNPVKKRTIDNRNIPYTVFLDPELARIGITEAEARAQDLMIKVYKIPAAMIPRAKARGETKGILKAVVDANTDLILGVSILCADAGEILGVIQVAMECAIPVSKLKQMMFTHPTMVEAINLWFND